MPNQYDPDSPWRDESKVALLKQMIAAGALRSEIARTLGVSRSAVIGKAKRLGLALAGSAGEEARAAGAKRWSATCGPKQYRNSDASGHRVFPMSASSRGSREHPTSELLDPNADPRPGVEPGHGNRLRKRTDASETATPETTPAPLMLTLLELEPHSCRWPFGDPDRPGFGFCGHAQAEGSSYCEAHRDISVGAAEAPDTQAAAA